MDVSLVPPGFEPLVDVLAEYLRVNSAVRAGDEMLEALFAGPLPVASTFEEYRQLATLAIRALAPELRVVLAARRLRERQRANPRGWRSDSARVALEKELIEAVDAIGAGWELDHGRQTATAPVN